MLTFESFISEKLPSVGRVARRRSNIPRVKFKRVRLALMHDQDDARSVLDLCFISLLLRKNCIDVMCKQNKVKE